MKSLYLDLQMGVAGDMLLASLLELCDAPGEILENIRGMGIPGLQAMLEKTECEGMTGTRVHMDVTEPADSRTLSDVHRIIESLQVSKRVKTDAKGVYRIIAEAEALVHETDAEHIHFHEVGALNAIADITGVCLLMEEIQPDDITVSPIHVGSGTVRCAHGVLPVPAPATAKILEGLPTYGGEVDGELCTPTGAALIRYFADEFGSIPEGTAAKTGRGFGTKVFPNRINGLKATIIE
ncbi:MAG: LarC family nickel insertion protein [Firmicutes bacterium]|nr:LarC family nickel insertion protein [Bacillota bacterium]